MLGPDGLKIARSNKEGGDFLKACKEVLKSKHVAQFIRNDMYRLGKTRIFLRADVLHLLDGIKGNLLFLTFSVNTMCYQLCMVDCIEILTCFFFI